MTAELERTNYDPNKHDIYIVMNNGVPTNKEVVIPKRVRTDPSGRMALGGDGVGFGTPCRGVGFGPDGNTWGKPIMDPGKYCKKVRN